MARKHEKFEVFTKQLVIALTNFTEDEENFGLCMDYVSSNFKYHKYLDPDSHKIRRTIDGLCNKFMVHCQDKKAETLRKLVNQFLEIPAFENRDHGKTETHWAVLSLLLELSESPTSAEYKERKRKLKPEQKDDFDWKSYLLEGEDMYVEPDFASPDISDDDEEEEKLATAHVKFKYQGLGFAEEKNMRPKSFDVSLVTEDTISDETWLQRNVMVQYWKGESNDTHNDNMHRSANLSRQWEDHLVSSSDIYVPADSTLVTEYQVLRETIWVLCGADCSFVYKIEGCNCTPNSCIKVTHLTQNSLYAMLDTICKYVNIIRRLQEFVDVVSSADILTQVNTANDNAISQTYQAFGNCVSKYMSNFKTFLVELEKQAMTQESPATLATFLQQLQSFFSELDLLSHILKNGIDACSHLTNTPQKISHLLAVIYDTLATCDTMGEHSLLHVCLLLPLWVETSKPYFTIIDNWICNGVLLDPRKEFIIQRNLDVQCLDETFWNTAFTMHTTPVKPKKDPVERNNEDVGDDYQVQYAPTFMIPVLHSIVMAGKSMEMLEHMGKKAEFLDHRENSFKRPTLYQQFISSMENFLGTNADQSFEDGTTSGLQIPGGSGAFSVNISNYLQGKEVRDPLLKLNFRNIVDTQNEFKAESLTENDEHVHRQLENLHLSGTSPVQLILQKCMYPHITSRYNTVCTGLLRIMKEEFKLMDYLAAMGKFYLMEAGDTMYDFYTEIFEKLRHREPWRDASYLNMLLQEALQAHYPEEIDRLTVKIATEKRSKDKQPVTALDGLELHYTVPWPVDVVLTIESMSTYNQVFGFLLQVKRVKYGLDELRFVDLEKEDILGVRKSKDEYVDLSPLDYQQTRVQLIHQMQILRMKLLTFVNGLHNYIMTRILHSTGLEFRANIEKARDLDELIFVHKNYLEKIHQRCLQHEQVKMIKDVVIKIFNLAITFQGLWDEGVDHLNKTIIGEMETEFSKFITFLSSILTNAIKRGSFQHLESLAFQLLSFNEQKKT